ncbi:MAG TPA: universal stress protein [Gemmatimonadaceae bacterium]|nr:universal stress protein [Gemmatimonadaceae bacterium]
MRVLVPLDGSDKDQRALLVGGALAELSHGEVRRVHVDDGDVADELLRKANDLACDLIVLATRAPGTLARAFFGSVADEVVRKASLPVVVVPPGAIYGSEGHIEIHRALVPLDGSSAALGVIDQLRALVPTRGMEYVLMHVVHPESTGGYMLPEPVPPFTVGDVATSREARALHVQVEHAELHLQELAEQLRGKGESATVLAVESTDPAAAIIDAVREQLVDLIAMSTRGAGGLERLLLGSVANRVARLSEVPVFLVTPRSS